MAISHCKDSMKIYKLEFWPVSDISEKTSYYIRVII